MNLVFIGFMGSGKSTVSMQLAKQLSKTHIEMDDLVLEKTAIQNMHEVFALGGELLLRETEIAIATLPIFRTVVVLTLVGGLRPPGSASGD